MRFSLPAAIVLFCATTALALPQSNTDNEIASLDGDDGLDLSNIDIVDIEYNPEDFEELATRATKHCSNIAPIKRVKKEYKGKCDPKNSKGWASGHNCKNKSGKSYLCVQGGKATCHSINDAVKNNFESGECFIAK
ncbi:hypothetical protein CC86DRAFT_406490 [Ophiobolus disseminans]|uniref:Uncharacterized protein n=1 Tax=Ophiobolus disseminans TaxID=1469910 RepID=A0A6A7A0G6_9PLEO|nr:hypothetical protein CC86DRAFT_406490 [Ophiobolus disseminans]